MIRQIRIQNFKSLRDVTVDLSPVTVFVGKSGTGKTNFASAIKFLRDCIRFGSSQMAQLFPACRCATNPSGPIGFQTVFDVPGFDEAFTYTIEFDADNVHFPKTESLEYGSRIVFRQMRQRDAFTSQWQTEPALVSVPDAGELALGRLPGLEEAVVAHTALTTAIGVYAFPYDVLNGAGAPPYDMPQERLAGLADDGKNALEIVGEIAQDLHRISIRKAITAALRQVNGSVVNIDVDSLRNPQKALVGHSIGEKTLTLALSQESDGFRRFYAHLLALYQPRAKQTLIFEEPENGIYPGALSLLADEFKATPDDNRGQVLLTTHSPTLLDHFSVDQIRVVELVELETRIGPLAEDQKAAIQEELLHAGELLTVDAARRLEV